MNSVSLSLQEQCANIGKAVLYPLDPLDAWDEKNLVPCRASRRVCETPD
jgi:hypothetical protein